MNRLVLAVALVAVSFTVTACASEEAMPAPSCRGGASIVLAAQSVPGATLVPCLDTLPDGWTVASVRIDQDGTVVSMDSDRAGDDAAHLSFRDRCEVDEAVETPSDLPPADRFEAVHRLTPSFSSERSYVFEGGCVTWTFEFAEGVSATESVAIGERLALVPRDELEAGLAETFVEGDL